MGEITRINSGSHPDDTGVRLDYPDWDTRPTVHLYSLFFLVLMCSCVYVVFPSSFLVEEYRLYHSPACTTTEGWSALSYEVGGNSQDGLRWTQDTDTMHMKGTSNWGREETGVM